MTCREITQFLLDYLSDDLRADVRTAFDAHIAVCPDCRNYIDGYRKAVAMGKAVMAEPVDAVPESLVNAILKSLG